MNKGQLVMVLRDAVIRGKPEQATSRVDRFVLTGEGVDEVITPGDDAPELVLVPGSNQRGIYEGSWKAVPRELVDSDKWVMFGGRYVTGDSRITDIAPPYGVIPVHDWVEDYQ